MTVSQTTEVNLLTPEPYKYYRNAEHALAIASAENYKDFLDCLDSMLTLYRMCDEALCHEIANKQKIQEVLGLLRLEPKFELKDDKT